MQLQRLCYCLLLLLLLLRLHIRISALQMSTQLVYTVSYNLRLVPQFSTARWGTGVGHCISGVVLDAEMMNPCSVQSRCLVSRLLAGCRRRRLNQVVCPLS